MAPRNLAFHIHTCISNLLASSWSFKAPESLAGAAGFQVFGTLKSGKCFFKSPASKSMLRGFPCTPSAEGLPCVCHTRLFLRNACLAFMPQKVQPLSQGHVQSFKDMNKMPERIQRRLLTMQSSISQPFRQFSTKSPLV